MLSVQTYQLGMIVLQIRHDRFFHMPTVSFFTHYIQHHITV